MVVQKSSVPRGLPKKTTSLCPECGIIIKAEIKEQDGKAVMFKKCPKHGEFTETIWAHVEDYLRVEDNAKDGTGIENPQVVGAKVCPFECGLCDLHLSTTCLANLDLTNRCNLKCPVCFANANSSGYVYEPDFSQIVEMMKVLRAERPIPTPAIQFAGGEPTIYPRFFDVIRAARDMGFAQIQVATNGIKFVTDPEFAQKCVDAGLHSVYLQFDGLRKQNYIDARGVDLLDTKLKAVESCMNTKPRPLATILVPTILKTINDDQVGEILNYAIEKRKAVRAINYQPVAFTGRIDQEERMKMRYTISDLIHDLTEQTDFISPEDFFPVPSVTPISHLASVITGQPKVAFTSHAHCGASTFLFIDSKGKATPLPQFIDIPGLFNEMEKLAVKTDNPVIKRVIRFGAALKTDESKKKSAIKAFNKYFEKYIIEDKVPSEIANLSQLLSEVLVSGNKESMKSISWNSVMIGCMHFQDSYNYDIERVKRCTIHYVVPDGRIIPFCAYNGGPTYRTEIEKKYSMTFKEWRDKNKGKDIDS